MKLTAIILPLAIAPVILAAPITPVSVEAREAQPGYGNYAKYGSYPPPAGVFNFI
jgi:hypothetical protein